MKKQTRLLLTLPALLVFLLACQPRLDTDQAELNVEFNTPLYSNIFTDISYNWKLKEGIFEYDPDYQVFVHFWQESTDMMLLQDDHPLPWKAADWKPGATLAYTHEDLYIPNFIDYLSLDYGSQETIILSAGIYHPDRADSKKTLLRKELKINPRPMDYPKITYARGWYPEETMEYQTVDPWKCSWRWTKQEADLIADNMHQDLELHVYGQVRADLLEGQEVEILIQGTPIDRFNPDQNIFQKVYRLKKEDLGEGDEFIIGINTNQTFVPARVEDSADERELGVRIMLINLLPVNR